MSLSNETKDLILGALGTPEAANELIAAVNAGSGDVSNVTASSPLASSGGMNPNISLTGIIPIANGGTGSATKNFVDLSTVQSIGGNKTFTGTVAASNLSGANSGDVTLAAVGSSPNANSASLTNQVLTLQPASASFPGIVNTSSQHFSGSKTFDNDLTLASASTTALTITTTSFIFDSVNNSLGIGAAPIANASIDITKDAGTLFQQIRLSAYGVQGGGLRFRGANGTPSVPTAAAINKSLGSVSAVGYGATQFSAASVALIDLQAAEAFTDTANGTYIRFATTPNGSVTRATRGYINNTGNFILGASLTDDATNLLQVQGGISVATAGKGISIKSGANARIGTSVLVGGTVTVANTSVTANSRIFVTSQVDGGTPGFLRVKNISAATSFDIVSSNGADTSTVAWYIIEST